MVRTASVGKAALTCTVIDRTEEPGPGRADPTRAVRSAVTIPAVPCIGVASVSAAASPRATTQARTSRLCSVRCADAISPGLISSNVLFTIVRIAATPMVNPEVAQHQPRPGGPLPG
jgi:hypothetical protein